MTLDDFFSVWEYWPALISGLGITLVLTVLSLAIGSLIGLVAALARLSRRRFLVIAASAYVDFFRTTPALVQIIWVFFVLPLVIRRDVNAFTAALVALGFNMGAYMAEIFRAGLLGVDRGQTDAASVLGLNNRMRFRYIVAPQAFRIVIPPIAATTMQLLKNTSLAAAIAVGELTYKANLVTVISGRFIEIFTLAAILYMAVVYPIGRGAAVLEKRLNVGKAA